MLQKAHLYTDLETIKPPLYDSSFIKHKKVSDGKNNDKSPGNPITNGKPGKVTLDPLVFQKFIPPFRQMPHDPDNTGVHELPSPPLQSPFDGIVVDHHHDFFPPDFNFPPPRVKKPGLLSLVKNRNNFLMKIFRRRRRKRPFRPYPPSPFPGMSGVYSPNPGYLVRQKFRVPY